jgi:hypothetical protein
MCSTRVTNGETRRSYVRNPGAQQNDEQGQNLIQGEDQQRPITSSWYQAAKDTILERVLRSRSEYHAY